MPPAVVPVQGVVQYADRASDTHDIKRRRSLHQIKPLAKAAPVTVLTTSMGVRQNPGNRFYWGMQPFNAMNGPIADVYTDAALTNAYASGGVVGTTVYVALTAANAGLISPRDTLMVSNSGGEMINVDVLDVVIASDTTSYAVAALLAADSTAILGGTSLRFTIIGSAEPEVHELPPPIFEEPVQLWNFTESMAVSAEVTDREENTAEYFDPNIMTRAKAQALMRLFKKREFMRFFGQRADKGKGRTMSRGIYNWLVDQAPTHIWDFMTDSTYVQAGSTWLNGGMRFLRDVSLECARFSETEIKAVWCGDLAANEVNEAALHSGNYQIKQGESAFGTQFTKIIGLRQPWVFTIHPLFATNDHLRRSACITEPKLLKTVTHKGRGLTFVPWGKGQKVDGYTYISANKCGWYVDEGIQIDNIDCFGWINNIGVTNTN